MAASVSIVLVDGGDDVADQANGAAPGAMPSRPVAPSESRPASPGSGSAANKDKSTTDAATALASAISKALGGVALVDAAIRLKQAFDDIYKAVTNLDTAINREQDDGSGVAEGTGAKSKRKTAVEPAARAKADDEDVIDGEFSFTPNKQADEPNVIERGL